MNNMKFPYKEIGSIIFTLLVMAARLCGDISGEAYWIILAITLSSITIAKSIQDKGPVRPSCPPELGGGGSSEGA